MTLAAHWVLATSNRGTAEELGSLLREAGLPLRITAQDDIGIRSVAETGATFVENALLKARHAARESGLPALADDSGLVVDALDGAPGVTSARFAGAAASDSDNVAKLLATLADVAGPRTARFHCVLVALRGPNDPAPLIAMGSWEGEIATTPSGSRGFGYDPVFFDRRLGRTAAELSHDEKNRVSHRGSALRRLVELLKNR